MSFQGDSKIFCLCVSSISVCH